MSSDLGFFLLVTLFIDRFEPLLLIHILFRLLELDGGTMQYSLTEKTKMQILVSGFATNRIVRNVSLRGVAHLSVLGQRRTKF